MSPRARNIAAFGIGLAVVTTAVACAETKDTEGSVAKGDGGGPALDGGSASEASSDASDASRYDDGGPPAPTNAKLLQAGDVFLLGVTYDGFAVYIASGDGDGPLRIVPLGGGAPLTLAPNVHFEHARVQGKAVAFWTNVIGNPLNGKLGVWTQATGVKTTATNTLVNKAVFSDDATRVALPYNLRPFAEPPVMDVAVTDVATLSTAPVIADVNLTDNGDYVPACTPRYVFVGRRLFISHCTTDRQSTSLLASVSETGVVTTVIDNAPAPTSATILANFSLDAAGEKAFVVGTDGTGRVVTLSTGASVTLDTSVTQGFIGPDGSFALYVKRSPPPVPDFPDVFSLRRTPTDDPSPRLLADDIDSVLALNRDLSGAMFKVNEALGDGRTNISFVETTRTPANVVALSSMSTGLPVGFSGTGRYALYMSDVPGAGAPIGTLKVHDSAATLGAPDRVVSKSAMAAVALSAGTKALYCDNVQIAATVGDRNHCDVMAFDAATTSAPTVVVSGADPYFFTTATQVAFVISTGTSKGLYVKNVP